MWVFAWCAKWPKEGRSKGTEKGKKRGEGRRWSRPPDMVLRAIGICQALLLQRARAGRCRLPCGRQIDVPRWRTSPVAVVSRNGPRDLGGYRFTRTITYGIPSSESGTFRPWPCWSTASTKYITSHCRTIKSPGIAAANLFNFGSQSIFTDW